MSPRRRGKPSLIDSKKLIEKIVSEKENIVVDNRIVSATHEIWTTLALALGLSPSTLHSYVVNNRYDLKNLLLDNIFNESKNSEMSDENNVTLNSTTCSIGENEFSFALKKADFEKMITETTTYTTIQGKKKRRVRTILKQNLWTDEISLAVWNAIKCEHAFKFESHYLTRDGSSGKMK
ncbi:hypothetical protein PV325_011331, partial [Microctonus aethiopoides]